MGIKNIQLEPFFLVGIKVRTTNQHARAVTDIGKLWGDFYEQSIFKRISGKVSNDIIAVYTDYESDFKGEYTCYLGCKVTSIDDLPEGTVGIELKGGKYEQYELEGKLPDIVVEKWQDIWKNDKHLNRSYIADFEVYNSDNPEDFGKVDILLGVEGRN